jgi:hypothetical protein
MTTHSRIAVLPFILLAAGLTFSACSEGDPSAPPVVNEHEPPTTLVAAFVPVDDQGRPNGDTTRAIIRDTTVVKGLPAIDGALRLRRNTRYLAEIRLVNESVVPSYDVTFDIDLEADSHMFLWTPYGGIDSSRILFSNFRADRNGALYGRTAEAFVPPGAPASGMLNIVLRHYDSGDKSDPVYDTDVNRNLPVIIE